jgi:catechol 2,3-dioxygenase-like lactoylglutathione lyase family enzyme
MTDPNFVLMYVDQPLKSAAFYEELLGSKPVEASPGFAMFVLKSGLKLGLWLKSEVEPKVTGRGATNELVFQVNDDGAVDATFSAWKTKGLEVAQRPTKMDFGYTFVALDPDGHRLRVYALAENPV